MQKINKMEVMSRLTSLFVLLMKKIVKTTKIIYNKEEFNDNKNISNER